MHIFTAMKQEDDQICPCNGFEYGQEFTCINRFGLQYGVVNLSDLNTTVK